MAGKTRREWLLISLNCHQKKGLAGVQLIHRPTFILLCHLLDSAEVCSASHFRIMSHKLKIFVIMNPDATNCHRLPVKRLSHTWHETALNHSNVSSLICGTVTSHSIWGPSFCRHRRVSKSQSASP